MRIFGGSINVMSMGGLAVAIGLVIDDAVVVVENIHRHATEGDGDVVRAVDELIAPLVSSTLTTVVVFAPLSLLSGVVGQFFRALSLSLSVAVLLSLGLSITIVPLLARLAFRRSHREVTAPRDSRLTRAYTATLGVMLRRPLVAAITAVLLAAVTVGLYQFTGTGFLPPADEGGFVLDYLTPAGIGTRGDGSPGAGDGKGPGRDGGGRVVVAAHRLGAGPVRHGAELRRHPRPPQASRPARSLRRGGHQRVAAEATARRRRSPSSSSCSSCRTCSGISRATRRRSK